MHFLSECIVCEMRFNSKKGNVVSLHYSSTEEIDEFI